MCRYMAGQHGQVPVLGWISSVGWSKLAGQVVSHVDRCVQKMHGSMGAGGFPPKLMLVVEARGLPCTSWLWFRAFTSSRSLGSSSLAAYVRRVRAWRLVCAQHKMHNICALDTSPSQQPPGSQGGPSLISGLRQTLLLGRFGARCRGADGASSPSIVHTRTDRISSRRRFSGPDHFDNSRKHRALANIRFIHS